MDDATIEAMSADRCGVKDMYVIDRQRRHKRFLYYGKQR